MKYLSAYSQALQDEVRALIKSAALGSMLLTKYPQPHLIRTDKALYQYVAAIRGEFLRNAAPIDKVLFDSKIHVIRHALGLHTTISRVQGNKFIAAREIRVASVFKQAPPEFLRMICVHELAHLKQREHDKAFYKLCVLMEPDYHQLEFDLRLYLTHLEAGGERLWAKEQGIGELL